MKLLHIIASMDPKWGGVCQALKTMTAGLNDFAQVENEILSFDNPDTLFIRENPVQIHALGAGKGPWFYNKTYILWLMQNINNYDVVILHGLWNYQGYGLIKAVKKLSNRKSHTPFTGKIFVMPHGMLDPYFQKASGRKLKAARNWFYWKIIENKVIDTADGLLFTCQSELELAAKTFRPYRPAKELVVGLGVAEPPAEVPAMREAFLTQYPSVQKKPYLLFLSRIHEKKGADLLIQAFSNLYLTKIKNASFKDKKSGTLNLVIAGPGLETDYGKKVEAAAQELENSVYFPGMLTGGSKWGAFYNCDAFVLPSHQENFGIAVVEALACGKPVLISEQVNIWREITASNAGIVAEDTLAGTTKLLASWDSLSKEQQAEMGKNARKCYEKYFAVAPAANNFLKAISV